MSSSLKAVFLTVRLSPVGDPGGGGAAEARLTSLPCPNILANDRPIFGPVRPHKEVAPANLAQSPGLGARRISARLLRYTHGEHSASSGYPLAISLVRSRGGGSVAGGAAPPARRPRGRTTHGQTSRKAWAGRGAAGPRPRFIPRTLWNTYLLACCVSGCGCDAKVASFLHGHFKHLCSSAAGLQGRGGCLRRVAGDLAQCVDRGSASGLYGWSDRRISAWSTSASSAKTSPCAICPARFGIAAGYSAFVSESFDGDPEGIRSLGFWKPTIQEAEESGRPVSLWGYVVGWLLPSQIPPVPRKEVSSRADWQGSGGVC